MTLPEPMGYLCLSVSSPGQTFIENVHFTKTVVTIRVSEPACYVAATAPRIFFPEPAPALEDIPFLHIFKSVKICLKYLAKLVYTV